MLAHPIFVAAFAALTAFLPLSLPMPAEVTSTEHAEPEARETMRITNHEMTLDGQLYKWSVIIPEGVEPGGAGLLFLHGYGECGTDGMRQLGVGLPPAIGANPERWPFVIIAPQKPVHNSEWEHHEKAVLIMLDRAVEAGLYDADRLAITGLSQGGHGTIAIGGRNADRFRAAVPVCGYNAARFDNNQVRTVRETTTAEDAAVVEAAERLKGTPVWLYHGGKDNVVPPEESRSLHAALEEIGGNVRYTEVPEANHNSWDDAYGDAALARWLVEQTR